MVAIGIPNRWEFRRISGREKGKSRRASRRVRFAKRQNAGNGKVVGRKELGSERA